MMAWREHNCQGAEPTTDLISMSDAELSSALAGEIARDPWLLDWPYGHRGRRIREEQYHREMLKSGGPDADVGSSGTPT